MLTTAFLVVVVLFAVSCKKEEPEKIGAVKDRKTLPGLTESKITTVISDSGVTRYRIYTDKMEIYDRSVEPYWEFAKGLHFERFAPNLSINATLNCNFARYYIQKKLWELKGKVRAVNLEGVMFETELLYWDEMKQKIYSDKFIRVTRPTMIISGVGFEADQSLTKWKILNPQGPIYIDENASQPPTVQPSTGIAPLPK
ncbi:MAG: LPS export ABC transporter periplasmic protein LptC [Paludibacteraceae bacterium]